MRNLYVCDNCLWNPAQYQDIGASIGFCLRYNSLLKNASHTTCRFFQRKDLPSFVAEDGHQEHAKTFAESHGIVYYSTTVAEQVTPYSHRHMWLTHTFDPYLHEVAMYHQMEKKWIYLETFPASRNPIKSIMYSSFVRRYIAQSGAQHDHYRMMLCLSSDLNETIELQLRDFRIELSSGEFEAVHETYLKDIVLLKLYALQEYGNIVHDDELMWVSDELGGALTSSWREFFASVRQCVPLIQSAIIASATQRKTFFPVSSEQNSQGMMANPVLVS